MTVSNNKLNWVTDHIRVECHKLNGRGGIYQKCSSTLDCAALLNLIFASWGSLAGVQSSSVGMSTKGGLVTACGDRDRSRKLSINSSAPVSSDDEEKADASRFGMSKK